MRADIVALILANTASTTGEKVLRLLCLTQCEYRKTIGDEAWAGLRRLLGHHVDLVEALAMWSGLMMGAGLVAQGSTKHLEILVPELRDPTPARGVE